MAEHTTLLSFDLHPKTLDNPVVKQKVQEEMDNQLGSFNFELVFIFDAQVGFWRQYKALSGCHATVRGYSRGLITIDIHEYVEKGCDPVFSSEVVATIEEVLKEILCCVKSKSFPAIRRGEEVDVYHPTGDGRIIEYDLDDLVYEANSFYQNIKVCHSKSHGNILMLDNDINLAESDVIFAHSLMRKGVNDFTDKDVLILGGGDGGQLNELRQENARSITMVDIDKMVMNAARMFLRGVCTDSFDSLKNDNYEVIVGDAFAFLEKSAIDGRQFDFILSDMTIVPLALSLKVLKPDGKYLCHANIKTDKPIEVLEEELSSCAGYKWNRKEAFIPSFHEVWTFYELERDSSP